MKQLYSFLFIGLLVLSSAHAQLNYNASVAQNMAGTYTDLGTNGSVIATADFDEANSAAVPIGFNFDFNGATRTHFILNTNGFVKLGNSAGMAPPSATDLFFSLPNGYADGVLNSTNADDDNIIAAFVHDLQAAVAGAEYRTFTTGAAGSQVCTIQYKNVRDRTDAPPPDVQFDSINFQIKLYETTNYIEIIFGNFYSSANTSAFKSGICGLKGTGTDITSVTKPSTFAYDLAVIQNGNYPINTNAFNFGNAPGRPIPDVGRTLQFKPSLPNDIQMTEVFTMGDIPLPYGIPHGIRAALTNVGANTITNKKVYLSITGANSYLDSTTIASVATGVTANVNFGNVPLTEYGVNTVAVYTNSDDDASNDTILLRQEIGESVYSYIDTTTPTGGVGFNQGTGIIANKYKVTGARYIKSVDVFIFPGTAGNNVFGVVANSAGTLQDQSTIQTITPAQENTWVTFDFPNPPLITGATNGDFYVGLGQVANPTVGYFPVGTIVEDPVRIGSYYSAGIGGGTFTDMSTGTLRLKMAIKANVGGNDLRIDEIVGLPNALCSTNNYTIEVKVTNTDSTDIDFSVDTLTLTASTTAPINQSFSVEINSGTLARGTSQNFLVTNNFDFSTDGNYNIVVEGDLGLEVTTADNTKNFPLEVIPTPGVDLLVSPTNTTICYGEELTFSAVPKTIGSRSYQWKIDGVNEGSVTTDSIFASTTLLTSSITVDLITEDCSSNPTTISSDAIDVTVNPPPISIAGKDTVIENTTEVYNLAPRAGSNFTWSVTGGTPSATTGTNVSITWGAAAKGLISVTEDAIGSCSYTSEVPVEIVSIVGIEGHDFSNYQLGDAFPNPTNGSASIVFSTPHSTQVNLTLFTLDGKKVKDIFSGTVKGQQKINVETNDLNAGIYYYEMKTADHRMVKKLTVLR